MEKTTHIWKKDMTDDRFVAIHKSVPRIDGYEKVTGKAMYAADRYMEGMLYAGVKRSPYSSAKVLSINTEKAKAIPGVHAVVTCYDMPKTKSWAGYMYLTDVIRYAGDCVAMVAAETKALVDDALDAIEVEYEELPGVYEIDDALEPGAHNVHENYPGNIFTDSLWKIRKGDVEDGFAKADRIIEREYRTQYVEHSYIEPECVLAYRDWNDGAMTVRSSSQNPFFTRRYIADAIGETMNRCRLIQEYVGGTFGGKEEGVGMMTGRAAYLAKVTKRPVKLVFTREDSFLESSKRHPFRLRYKAGVMNDGTIVAWEGEQVDNCGAYNNQTQFMNWRASVHSSGPYEIPNIKTDTYGVFTNNIHGGAFRGYSSPQLIFGQEQFIEEIAEELGMDEVEFRRKNCLKDGSTCSTGEVLHNVLLEEIMDYTVEKADYKRKHAEYKKQTNPYKRKGIGMSICYRGCGFGAESPDSSGCMMMCNDDGSVSISTGMAENGQGLKTAYSQIAAEALGVHYEDIRFHMCDTYSIADCGLTAASRGTVMGAQSVRKAGESLKQVMIKNAMTLKSLPIEEAGLSWSDIKPADIDIRDGRVFLKERPEVGCDFKAVAGGCVWAGLQLSVYEWFDPAPCPQEHETGQGKAFPTYAYACCIAEVEVDMRTGYVDLQKITVSHDVGRAINPALAMGQIYGGAVMGQGFAITEDVAPRNGRVKNVNFDKYIIPTSMDAPVVDIALFESEDPAGTYCAKSLGEPATESIGGAVANAIYNATGRRNRINPADLETVLLGKKL